MSQRIVPQPALSRALQRRLSTPAISHDFDVVSDTPPPRNVQKVEEVPEQASSDQAERG